MDKQQHGQSAELIAEQVLVQAGLQIYARNFRSRYGEIDLIARDPRAWVFCEVRLRRSHRWGGAAESITRSKQQRIVAKAVYFLKTHSEAPCRFDVLLLEALDIDHVEWIKDAFRP